jgi:hypothetical protein
VVDQSSHRKTEAEGFCYRYLSFWLIIALVGFPFLGWGTLIAWLGLAWGLLTFLRALLVQTPYKPRRSRARTK